MNFNIKNIKLISKLLLSLALFLLVFVGLGVKAHAADFDLIQTDGDSRVFLIENNAKRYIKDYDTFISFGFKTSQIRKVSRSEFDSYSTAPTLTRVLNYNGQVYVIISGMKAYVGTSDALILNGFSWSDLVPFADPTFGKLPDTTPLTANNVKAVHIPSLKRIYYIENGYRRWIKDWDTWAAWRDFTGSFVESEAAKSLPEAPPLSRVLSYNGRVYAIENGTKRYVPTSEALVLNNYSWGSLETFADPTFGQMSEGSALTAPKVVACGSEIDFISGGMRHHIEDWDTYQNLGGSFTNSPACVNLPKGPSIKRLLQGSDGRTFYIQNNQRRYIPDPGTFSGYGFSWSNVRQVGQDVIDAIDEGSSMARWVSNLLGNDIPATSGKTGREQHLWTTRGEGSDADHYAITNVPTNLRNGIAGTGAFGRIDSGIEQYYITMRWNYCNWTESGTDPNFSSNPGTICASGSTNMSTKNWHYGKKVIVSNSKNGRKIVAAIGESGPAIWVTNQRGVVSGLSPEATDYIVGSSYGAGGDGLEYGWAVDQTLPLGPLTW
ncbi:MAG: hypothetical protein M1324_00780 [Patescibacteria group bacterium]|nr:hypothetical protein [Patescibacteria group bacterium]